jgi:hypothetical protein
MPNIKLIPTIQSAITDEIFYALGLQRRGFLRRSLGWIFTPVARAFARIAAAVDEATAQGGPPAGCQKMLDLLGIDVQTMGRSNIPLEGPVIILANHPGAYDSMAIGSLLPRRDLKAIVAKTRFYQVLPHIHPELLYASEDQGANLLVLKGAVEHLRRGGSLLQFGSGLIEPDPATHPVREDVFEKWSPSLEILLRKVPETQVVPTIASGVLLERFLHHPLVKLRKDSMDKRRLAEFIQIIQQILFPKTVDACPQISFGKPFALAEIEGDASNRRIMPAVINNVKDQLNQHIDWINSKKNKYLQ